MKIEIFEKENKAIIDDEYEIPINYPDVNNVYYYFVNLGKFNLAYDFALNILTSNLTGKTNYKFTAVSYKDYSFSKYIVDNYYGNSEYSPVVYNACEYLFKRDKSFILKIKEMSYPLEDIINDALFYDEDYLLVSNIPYSIYFNKLKSLCNKEQWSKILKMIFEKRNFTWIRLLEDDDIKSINANLAKKKFALIRYTTIKNPNSIKKFTKYEKVMCAFAINNYNVLEYYIDVFDNIFAERNNTDPSNIIQGNKIEDYAYLNYYIFKNGKDSVSPSLLSLSCYSTSNNLNELFKIHLTTFNIDYIINRILNIMEKEELSKDKCIDLVSYFTANLNLNTFSNYVIPFIELLPYKDTAKSFVKKYMEKYSNDVLVNNNTFVLFYELYKDVTIFEGVEHISMYFPSQIKMYLQFKKGI